MRARVINCTAFNVLRQVEMFTCKIIVLMIFEHIHMKVLMSKAHEKCVLFIDACVSGSVLYMD